MSISFQLNRVVLEAAAQFASLHQPAIKSQIARAKIICSVCVAIIICSLAVVSGGRIRATDLLFALISAVIGYFLMGFLVKRSFIQKFVQIASDGKPDF